MTECMLALFTSGIYLSGWQRFLLMLPLCLSISVVYKTMRCENLKDVLTASLLLWVTIVVGMYAVGLGLFILLRIMV